MLGLTRGFLEGGMQQQRELGGRPAGQPAAASGKAPTGKERLRDELRGQEYDEQQRRLQGQAAENVGAPGDVGMPDIDPQEALAAARDGFFSADVAATYTRGGQIAELDGNSLELDTGTRFSATLYRDGVHFRAEPGVLVKLPWKPDVRISRISYSFSDGTFSSDAEGESVNLLGLVGWAAERKINGMLESKLRPLLPAKLRQKGYSVSRDDDLPGTLAQLQQCFQLTGGQDGAGSIPMDEIVDPSVSVQLTNPRELKVPLTDQGLEFLMPAGVHLYLSAHAKGSLADPHIESLYMRANNPGLTIRSTGTKFSDAFKSLDMNSVTIEAGGEMSFDYDLMVEDLVNGGVALIQLFALLSGERVNRAEDVKLNEVRKRVDELLQQKVPPMLKDWLLEHDGLIPGVSLKSLFGV